MLNKKIIVSNHVKERFSQRKIKFTNNKDWKYTIIQQIKYDLRPLNIRRIIKLNDLESKVITRQGKVYIVKELENENLLIVKTVYKIDLRDEIFKKEGIV